MTSLKRPKNLRQLYMAKIWPTKLNKKTKLKRPRIRSLRKKRREVDTMDNKVDNNAIATKTNTT